MDSGLEIAQPDVNNVILYGCPSKELARHESDSRLGEFPCDRKLTNGPAWRICYRAYEACFSAHPCRIDSWEFSAPL